MAGMFFLLFLLILLCAEIQLWAYRASALYLEDALAASNLASAVIHIEEYGVTHTVCIADPSRAFNRYADAVKVNLQLNDSWECENRTLISGPVTIERYIVYNVGEEEVEICHVSNNGSVRREMGIPGRVAAPNGISVEETSVYSEISFTVKGFPGITVEARKGKLVDIVAEKGGEENEQGESDT